LGVQGSGFRDWGSGFRVQGSRFRVQGSGFRVQGRAASNHTDHIQQNAELSE
jgi:hypothetical protein